MHKYIARCMHAVYNGSTLNIVKSPDCYCITPYHTNGSSRTHLEGPRWRSFSTVLPNTMEKLFSKMASKNRAPNNKITVVGAPAVTSTIAFTLLAKKITNEICIIDVDDQGLRGEQLDLQYGSMYLNNAKIVASKDYVASADSKICIIAAGTQQGRHENREEFVAKNAGIFEAVVPPLVKNSPNANLIVASEPVDLLSHVTWKVSGHAMNRIIGTGTSLDTNRFRFLVAQKLGVAPASCHGYIIGERGEYSVPVWSSLNVAGVRLSDFNPLIGTTKDPEHWQEIHRKIINSDGTLRNLKGGDSWAMALAISDLCGAILSNANSIHTVSTYAKGEHRIFDEVFLSLPCVLGRAGVTDIIKQPLSEHETGLLRKSVDSVAKSQECLKILA